MSNILVNSKHPRIHHWFCTGIKAIYSLTDVHFEVLLEVIKRQDNHDEATYNVDATMLAMVNLVVPHNRVATGTNLYAGESVAIDVVLFYQTSTLPKYINSALVTIEYLILPENQISTSQLLAFKQNILSLVIFILSIQQICINRGEGFTLKGTFFFTNICSDSKQLLILHGNQWSWQPCQ